MNDVCGEFYALCAAGDIPLYERLTAAAIELGYKPKRDKTKTISISFSNPKTKKTLLKYTEEKGEAFWRFKFYGNTGYSEVFDASIKDIISRYDFKYVGCYGCGKCRGEKLGYRVDFADGRSFFRCGFELIPIRRITAAIVDEALRMMERQHRCFLSELEI
jgi:hypothetical protein